MLSNKCIAIKTAEVDELYRITLEDDSTIECTSNHLFLVKDNNSKLVYRRADELSVGDDLVSVDTRELEKIIRLIKNASE